MVCSLIIIFHLVAITRAGHVRVHSYSTGMSWSFWPRLGLDAAIVRILVEPGSIVLVAVVAGCWDEPLSIWLYGAGVCLFIKEAIGAWNHRHRVLDAIDARLESERMNEAIRRRITPRGRSSQATQRVEVSQAEPSNPPQQTEMFSNLDPGLQNLFSQTPRNSPSTPANPAPSLHQGAGGPLGHLPRIVSPRRHRPS